MPTIVWKLIAKQGENSISNYLSNKLGLIWYHIKFLFVHSVKFVHKNPGSGKSSLLGVKKRGGADVRLCFEKNNNVTLQVYYWVFNHSLKCNFTDELIALQISSLKKHFFLKISYLSGYNK